MPVTHLAEVVQAQNSLLISHIGDHRILFDTGGITLGAVIAEGDNPNAFENLAIGQLPIGGPLNRFPGWSRRDFQVYLEETRQNDSIDLILGAVFLRQLQVLIFSRDGVFRADDVEALESWKPNWQEVVCRGRHFPTIQTDRGPLFFDSGMAKTFLAKGLIKTGANHTLGQPDSYFYSPFITGGACVYEGNLGITLNAQDGPPIEVTSKRSAKTIVLNPHADHQVVLGGLNQFGFNGFLGCDLLDEFDIAISYPNHRVLLRKR